MMNKTPYYAPVSNTLEYHRALKPDWLIHFTDEPKNIEEEGFQYGHPEVDGVHLTTWKKNRNKEPGFNFAFPADSKDARNGEGKYGRHAVLFMGGGIKVYHSGDEEYQVIFWGPHVKRDMVFPIHADSNGDWSVEDYSGRELVAGKTLEEAVSYVKTNWQMLKHTREKHRKR